MDICSKKSQFVSKGLVVVTKFLQENPDCSVIVFCNSWKQSQHFAKELEKKLDHKRLSVDVVNINGTLDKIDKFWWIRLFCEKQKQQRDCIHGRLCTCSPYTQQRLVMMLANHQSTQMQNCGRHGVHTQGRSWIRIPAPTGAFGWTAFQKT